MRKKTIYVTIIGRGKLRFKHPIFERLQTDPNNPWFLQEQIQFYKDAGIPIAFFALPGQKKKHYYAIFEAESQAEADRLNKEFYKERDRAERAEAKRIKYETDSYDVKVENGYDAPAEESDPYEIIARLDLLDALVRHCSSLAEEKKRICDTIKKGLTQRAAANEMGMPKTTYLDHMNDVLRELKRKLEN